MIRGCKIQDMDRKVEKTFKEKIILKSSLAKETVAEFLGTFMMVVLGCGSVAQAVLSRGTAGGTITANVGFALAVGMAVYVTGGISGGHINPAVSFAMCLYGRMNWFRFPFYVGAQFLGAFLGAATLFGIYYDALQSFADGKLLVTGENATAQIFATYPIKYLTLPNEFADQVLSSTFLLVVVFAIFDDKNWRVPRGLEPIVIGLLILVLSSSLGLNSGCAMNPARDLGPRIFTALAGWGLEVFTAGSHFWWIPVVGPFLGGALGGFIYIYGIEIHHAQPESDEKTEQVEEKHELSVIM
ncbi:aquaporin-9 isoform X1 [Trichosurus vulpecula]|uniref:aquaporin-9 isoform X1 n=1 Tax=Trichosurus vulpecula TaxID=9337 RepID=UPI00186B29F0|nr:aquaporin-9 isoform X1 [Trichosurus vulpecula]